MKTIKDEVKAAIRNDRETAGLSIYQLVAKYGVSKSSVALIVKGCSTANLKRASPLVPLVRPSVFAERPSLSKTDIGEAARQMICARLMLSGVVVFRPMTEDTPTDLLVLARSGTALKCQCKYIFPTERGCHCLPLYSTRKNGAGSKAVKHLYTAAEVDFFLGYCVDNDTVYVVPFAEAQGRSSLNLWIARQKVGTSSAPGFDESKWRNRFDLLK